MAYFMAMILPKLECLVVPVELLCPCLDHVKIGMARYVLYLKVKSGREFVGKEWIGGVGKDCCTIPPP